MMLNTRTFTGQRMYQTRGQYVHFIIPLCKAHMTLCFFFFTLRWAFIPTKIKRKCNAYIIIPIQHFDCSSHLGKFGALFNDYTTIFAKCDPQMSEKRNRSVPDLRGARISRLRGEQM